MLDRKIFDANMEKLCIFFPDWGKDYANSKRSQNAFYEELKHIPKADFEVIVACIVRYSRYEPSISTFLMARKELENIFE